MRYTKTSRRLFLTGAAGAALALPLLPSLLPRSLRRIAEAAAPETPRRFVAIKSYSGAPVMDWYPRRAPSGYGTHSSDGTVALTERLGEATGRHSNGEQYFGRSAPLSDFAETGVSNVFSRVMNPYLDHMLLMRGLDFMPAVNHNHGGYLGCFGLSTDATDGPVPGAQINATIDHVMAASPCVYPAAPPGPRVLHLGSRVNTASYAPRDPSDVLAIGQGAIERAQAFTNPRTAVDAVFASFGGSDDMRPNPSARLVDRVIEDYRRAWDSPHLSARDRQALDRHLTHLSELEARVQGMGTMTCQMPDMVPNLDTGGEFSADVGQVTELMEAMVDIIALALSCDATRVVTLDVSKMVVNDGGEFFGMGDSTNANSAGRGNWHYQAHEWTDNAKRWLGLGNQWIAETVVARLLERMLEVDERDGESLLHHSMVMWSNELSFNHLNYSMPTAMWGQAGGYLRTGRYIDYIDHERPTRFRQHDGSVVEGVQFNRLLVTIMQAMGLTPDEYEREPGRGYGEYRPVGKGGGFARDYDESNVGNILPSIR